MASNAAALLFIENQASVSDPSARTGSFFEVPDSTVSSSNGVPDSITFFLQTNAITDDITNHNISGPSTGVR
jgi:hypothetical protein